MIERKIISEDISSPLISRKKKRQGIITLGVVILLVIMIAGFIVATTGTKIKKIGNYTIAKVKSGDLITSTEASGSVVLPTQVSIVAMNEAYVLDLYVQVGEIITKSTVLAQLEIPDLEQDKVDLINELETLSLNLDQTKLNSEYALKEFNIRLGRLENNIIDALSEVERTEKLKNLKSSRVSDYEDAQDILKKLYEEKEDLLLEIEKENRQVALSIKSNETKISQAQTYLARVQNNLNNANITSPISGTVMTINQNLSVPGSLISQSTELFTVADTEDVYIDLEVYEEYRTTLKVGGLMDILVSSKIIEAEIIQIGSVASLSSDSLAATIEVRAKPIGDVDLTSGASAVADIPLGTKKGALLLPRGSYLTTGNQKYVYKIDGDLAIRTKVVYGSIDGNQVEIISGLKAGDKIIISSYQSFIDQDSIELK